MAAAHGTGGVAIFWSKTSLTANQVIQLMMENGTSLMLAGTLEGTNAKTVMLYVQV